MSKEITLEDAISIAWQNAPDAMDRIVTEIKSMREAKYEDVRGAKRKGMSADWIEGEMLAYDEIAVNLSQPESSVGSPL